MTPPPRIALNEDAVALTRLHARSRAFYYGDALQRDDVERDRLPMWTRFIGDPERRTYVLEAPDGLTGFIHFHLPPIEDVPVELVGLYVAPELVGSGLGSLLYAEFEQSRGRRRSELEVWHGNHRAERFYEHRGWKPTNRTRDGVAGEPFVTWVLDPGA